MTHASLSANFRAEALVWRAYLGWLENTADSLRRGLTDAAQAMALVTGSSGNARWIIAHAHLFSARIHLLLGAPEAALAASTEALSVRMTDFGSSFFNFHFTHSRALRAVGRTAEADDYLRRAYERVVLVANNTKDETLRRSWLENVRDNREIVAEWESRKR